MQQESDTIPAGGSTCEAFQDVKEDQETGGNYLPPMQKR